MVVGFVVVGLLEMGGFQTVNSNCPHRFKMVHSVFFILYEQCLICYKADFPKFTQTELAQAEYYYDKNNSSR